MLTGGYAAQDPVPHLLIVASVTEWHCDPSEGRYVGGGYHPALGL